MSDLAAPGPELRRRNRKLVAERLRWPAGAVDACEAIEQEHPLWIVWWQDADSRRARGWYAMHQDHWHLEPDMYGATPDALRTAITGHRCHTLNPPVGWSWI